MFASVFATTALGNGASGQVASFSRWGKTFDPQFMADFNISGIYLMTSSPCTTMYIHHMFHAFFVP
jgi:hypothetical protein